MDQSVALRRPAAQPVQAELNQVAWLARGEIDYAEWLNSSPQCGHTTARFLAGDFELKRWAVP